MKKETIKAPRGTYDISLNEMSFRQDIVNSLFDYAATFGFTQIQTPMFEATELFKRAVGEETDVVSKEMYTFDDKKGRSLTLRPEMTASVVRSFIENKYYATNPDAKFSYYGPAFRYERPQAGRFRQFHQFGIETFGSKNPYLDAEGIILANNIFTIFGLENEVKLQINSLGNKGERDEYVEQLKNYFLNFKDELCEDCQVRLEKNSLRVLDCKVDYKKDFFKKAPKLFDSLGKNSKDY